MIVGVGVSVAHLRGPSVGVGVGSSVGDGSWEGLDERVDIAMGITMAAMAILMMQKPST